MFLQIKQSTVSFAQGASCIAHDLKTKTRHSRLILVEFSKLGLLIILVIDPVIYSVFRIVIVVALVFDWG